MGQQADAAAARVDAERLLDRLQPGARHFKEFAAALRGMLDAVGDEDPAFVKDARRRLAELDARRAVEAQNEREAARRAAARRGLLGQSSPSAAAPSPAAPAPAPEAPAPVPAPAARNEGARKRTPLTRAEIRRQLGLSSPSSAGGAASPGASSSSSSEERQAQAQIEAHRARQQSLADSMADMVGQLKAGSVGLQDALRASTGLIDQAASLADKNVDGVIREKGRVKERIKSARGSICTSILMIMAVCVVFVMTVMFMRFF